MCEMRTSVYNVYTSECEFKFERTSLMYPLFLTGCAVGDNYLLLTKLSRLEM